MLNICVFAGTTEGREVIEYLSDKNILVTACVATEYGEEVIPNNKAAIHVGRLDYDKMVEFFNVNKFDLIIDATHPYAKVVTKNIIDAANKSGVKYLRLNRSASETVDGNYFPDIEAAVDYLSNTNGNILLTTGSNELSKFTRIPNFKERIYPRILPLDTSLESCKINGYDSSHIIAMQGPFTEELNKAIIKAFDIKILVTKEAGANGGFMEKIKATKKCNIECVIINRPENKEGKSFDEVIDYLNSVIKSGSLIPNEPKKRITNECFKYVKPKINIVGIGVGNISQMTFEASNAIKQSDVIIGAKRILESCVGFNKPMHCAFMPNEVLEYINSLEEASKHCHKEHRTIAILLSGDVGFYSGAKKLLDTLKDYDTNIICGISSPIYLCSKLGFSWDDISLCSLHGRDNNIIHSVKTSFRTFTLVGGEYGVNELCDLLIDYNFSDVKLYIGEKLSYTDEKITVGTASELGKCAFDKLASVIIENGNYNTKLNVGLDDEAFIRFDKVPMTKSEVRAVSISKLKLSNDSVVYDIGAGSGSVAIEMAMQAYNGIVYAVEKSHEAIELINKNKMHLAVPNLEIIEGFAPEAIKDLPKPTHAFIGGSSGNLSKIVEMLLEKNKNVRIVINAITLETMAEAIDCIKRFNFENAEIVNLSVSKSRKLGNYNMMMAQNPIYIISCSM